MQGGFALTGIISELIVGVWIKATGYTAPYIFGFSMGVINVLYILFLVPEIRPRQKSSRINICGTHRNVLQVEFLKFK